MRHRRKVKTFNRKFNARKSLFRGLMVSLVEHGRIKTTVEKAKELRRHIEPAITLGKTDDLATRRLLISRIANPETVDKILKDVSPRFKERAGGYTRVIKIGRRPGDTSEMAFIEFVDFDYKAVAAKPGKGKAAEAEAKKDAKAKSKTAKKQVRATVAKKKNVRRIKAESRAENRA